MNRIALYGAVAVVIAGMIAGFWLNYQKIIDDNQTLAAQNAETQAALRSSEAATRAAIRTIGDWSDEQARTQISIDAMAAQQIEATKETRRLSTIFGKHDIERLARAKPVLVQTRINDGAARAWRLLRESTTPRQRSTGGTGKAGSDQIATPGPNTGPANGLDGGHARDDPKTR